MTRWRFWDARFADCGARDSMRCSREKVRRGLTGGGFEIATPCGSSTSMIKATVGQGARSLALIFHSVVCSLEEKSHQPCNGERIVHRSRHDACARGNGAARLELARFPRQRQERVPTQVAHAGGKHGAPGAFPTLRGPRVSIRSPRLAHPGRPGTGTASPWDNGKTRTSTGPYAGPTPTKWG